ncbi:SDR family oxidoreductase [Paenibacillus sp. J2TS4]|uniref:SDR family oxidoreductase n=1 Tax=Paenibacillus sp. J2TS4 TaxID=2807194 RepID=UPI001B044877|nr:SDR family oxidoreductase [Paenibacillus sp. J2TS4]GIP35761.1 short-chain dehydrogenase/reductase [Paenibacillus sp. J2TS4]
MNAGKHGRPVALVTGSSSGFGMHICIALAKQGYTVMATMRNTGRGTALLQMAQQEGAEVASAIQLRQLDVTDAQLIDDVVEQTVQEYGHIDLLVNNAGYACGGYAEEVPLEEWREQFETNFFGLVSVTKAVIPYMRERRQGTIVNMSSISGLFGLPGYAPYAASKFAVEGFSEALRLELLPFGVHVVLIEPGAYNTAIWQKGFDTITIRSGSPYREWMEAVLRFSRRAADTAPGPEHVAEMVAKIARTSRPGLRYPTGRGSLLLRAGRRILPWRWLEKLVLRILRG